MRFASAMIELTHHFLLPLIGFGRTLLHVRDGVPFASVMTFLLMAGTSDADFNGFGNFSQFKINQADSGAAPLLSIANDRIQLTNAGSTLQARSIFNKTPQAINGPFTATFTYQMVATQDAPFGVGVMFVIQNSVEGIDALGAASSNLGYGGIGGIDHSVALSLELDNGGRSGLYTDGNKGFSNGTLTSPLSLGLGHVVNVTIEYDGSVLTETLTDSVTLASYSADYLMDIPTIVGNDYAFIGFTGSTGPDSYIGARDQYISNVTFSTVPEISSVTMVGVGIVGFLTYRLRRR